MTNDPGIKTSKTVGPDFPLCKAIILGMVCSNKKLADMCREQDDGLDTQISRMTAEVHTQQDLWHMAWQEPLE